MKREGKGSTEERMEAIRNKTIKAGTDIFPFSPCLIETRKTIGVIQSVLVSFMIVAV